MSGEPGPDLRRDRKACDPAICGGKPCIRGHRIRVTLIGLEPATSGVTGRRLLFRGFGGVARIAVAGNLADAAHHFFIGERRVRPAAFRNRSDLLHHFLR